MTFRPPGPPADDAGRDARLGAALSGLPVPDHGPTFWADLSTRLEGEGAPVQTTESAAEAGPGPIPAPAVEPVSLDDRRARRAGRWGRTTRSLGAAAAALAVVVAAAGALTVVRQGDGTDSQVSTGARPTGTTPAATTPASFSATYDGIEGWDGPDGCCSTWRLTLGSDGSYRWTSTDGRADIAYDDATGRHVEVLTVGPDASPSRPRYVVTTGVPAGGPDQRAARPEPLDPVADFVTALARAGDPRISQSTIAGRAAWHYDGPSAADRLGGDAAPNHVVADVDQATGILLHLTRRFDDMVVNRFAASGVSVGEAVDRAQFRIDPPPGANVTTVTLGFDGDDRTLTVAEAAAAVPYDLLVPGDFPQGFSAGSVMLNRDVPSPTGPEGMNPPATQVVVMTWAGPAGSRFSVTLRPGGGRQWDDPFGREGVVLDSSPIRFDLPGRAPLEGAVAVDAPASPHLWGVTGDIVVTISGDLSRAELERAARSLRAHRN